jgi:uncharacterized protein YdaU (DUF1376 family)
VNYFEHHIGDYAAATGHLSYVEDAAYSRLLRIYYRDERPLPSDLKVVQRMAGARTREEREAVETVLGEFFFLVDGAWHNKRADEEIAKVEEKRAKARRSAEARWNPREEGCDRNAFAMRTHSPSNASASETHNGRNALQTPDTRHQTPEDQKQASPSSTAAPSTDLLGRPQPADLSARRAERLATITEDAIEAYNRILGKPGGKLPSVSKVGRKTRRAEVNRILQDASDICLEQFGDKRVTPEFWQAYFEACDSDPWMRGDGPYTGAHANWKPDFEFLTKPKTLLRVFERSTQEDAA